MTTLLVVTDAEAKDSAVRQELGAVLTLEFCAAHRVEDKSLRENVLIDIDMADRRTFRQVGEWLKHQPAVAHRIVAIDRSLDLDKARAAALGATDNLFRPLNMHTVLAALLGDFDALLLDASRPPIRSYPGVAPVVDALQGAFSVARLGAPLDRKLLDEAFASLSDHVAQCGLERWLNIVRCHHSQTYQHSLIVSGLMSAFCRHLGFNHNDQLKMVEGALLHDLGKSQIPVAVLEKGGPLGQQEVQLMRKHPEYGFGALARQNILKSDTLDMVLHHHELLDGTGYPHGLSGERISDMVRIMTITDIFGALLENRSYKKSLTCEAAYHELIQMGSKLDRTLVKEFAFCNRVQLQGPARH